MAEVEKWMDSLQEITKETWRSSKTSKVSKKFPRIVFKRLYHCHFNSRRRKTTKNLKTKKSKNIDCPAKILITIKKTDSQFPSSIEFKDIHNHRLNVCEALRERPMGEDAKNQICQLFDKGHSPSSAYHTYYISKMEELGDQYDSLAFDRYYFPTKSDVSNLWQKNFKKRYGERSGQSMLLMLNELLMTHAENNGTVFKIPIMQRVQMLPQSSEVMFVDATGNCDTDNHKVYFFLIQTAEGGMPVGCIITNTGKSSNFDHAVSALVEIMPKRINPVVIMTDDDLTERNTLKKYWPEAKLLLCTFHVLKACWRWLGNGKNMVPKAQTQHLYKLFRNILYAKTEEELEVSKENFFKNCNHLNFKKYVDSKLGFIEDWCILHRKIYILRGSNTNNYSKVMFRLLKDIPLERTKAFNVTQLTDFIISGFESYFKQRILDLLHGRVTKAISSRYNPKIYKNDSMTVKNLGNMEFEVTSETDKVMYYKVDMSVCKCTCPFGFDVKFCKHQNIVLQQFDELKCINTLSQSTKLDLYKVATGVEPDQDIFLPLQSDNINSKSMIKTSDQNPYATNLNDQNVNEMNLDERAICTIQNKNFDTLPNSQEIDNLQQKWMAFNNEILNNLKESPAIFVPAVQAFLSNKETYAKTENSLVSGLFTAFKYAQLNTSKIYRNAKKLKGKKIPVQPTAIGRRKSKTNSKRRLSGGRHQKKAPHNLTKCVEKNIQLGDNKTKK